MTKDGFKEITLDNWLVPDDIPSVDHIPLPLQDAETTPLSPEEYVPEIMRPKLDQSVPADVKELFEIAQGAMIYGYFFHPLYTLASEQLGRAAEAAVANKCEALGAPKHRTTNFIQSIHWLADSQIISFSDFVRWDQIREFRNQSSDTTRLLITRPREAVTQLDYIAKMVNSLFPSSDDGEAGSPG